MRFGLEELDIVKIQNVFSSHLEVEKAILYGSRAMGNFRNGSDIDIALIGKSLNLTIINEIETEIDNLNLPYLFDISNYHQIKI